jgi:hypothetical protein
VSVNVMVTANYALDSKKKRNFSSISTYNGKQTLNP